MLNILSIADILTEDIAFLKANPFNSFLAQDTTQEIIGVGQGGHPQKSSHCWYCISLFTWVHGMEKQFASLNMLHKKNRTLQILFQVILKQQ